MREGGGEVFTYAMDNLVGIGGGAAAGGGDECRDDLVKMKRRLLKVRAQERERGPSFRFLHPPFSPPGPRAGVTAR